MFQRLSTPADPGFWLRFRSAPVLTYPRTLRSGPRESLAKSQAWRAGSRTVALKGSAMGPSDVSQRSLQNFGTRFTALRAARCASTVALTVLRPATWTSYSSRATPSGPANASKVYWQHAGLPNLEVGVRFA